MFSGPDIDADKIPLHLKKNDNEPLFTFLEQIINATKEHVCAYKPNIAFFEALGFYGLELLEEILAIIPEHIPVILDVKRGDIGNTAKKYAIAAFDELKVDAVTLAPYMGSDSIIPFLEYKDKYSFVLVLTSNKSSQELEMLKTEKGTYLFQETASLVNKWNSEYHNCGAVMGATNPDHFGLVENDLNDSLILVPGIGTQGGKVSDILTKERKNKKNYLFNVSRDIIYASNGEDFATIATEKAIFYKNEINQYL
ncbi:MAG: orotidine-5'-phosphate decarboxylase [Candidatus Margulisbacteria bacterium]|nr:orotidine-5'-phosphate decarboxylase [Candidatus Margulisiibacteriota bacterium]